MPYLRWGWTNAKHRLRSRLPGKRLTTCLMANMAFDILQFTCCMWFFHVRCSSMQIPRNLTDVSMQLLPILFNGVSFMNTFILSKSRRLCFGLITIYLVLFAFSDNLFCAKPVQIKIPSCGLKYIGLCHPQKKGYYFHMICGYHWHTASIARVLKLTLGEHHTYFVCGKNFD